MLWGPETWPLYGVERWPQIRGFLSAILNGHAIRTKVSGRYRQGGRTLEVVVKRGSTVVRIGVVSKAFASSLTAWEAIIFQFRTFILLFDGTTKFNFTLRGV